MVDAAGAGGVRAGGEVERERWRPERLGATELEREPSLERRAAGLLTQNGSEGWRPKFSRCDRRRHGADEVLAEPMAATTALRSGAAPVLGAAGACWS
jgi:hypothetical protein